MNDHSASWRIGGLVLAMGVLVIAIGLIEPAALRAIYWGLVQRQWQTPAILLAALLLSGSWLVNIVVRLASAIAAPSRLVGPAVGALVLVFAAQAFPEQVRQLRGAAYGIQNVVGERYQVWRSTWPGAPTEP
jgi:hypothetical protein